MEGIVYKVQSYKENDRLVFVYTPKGKITLVSKGSQKTNSKDRIVAQYLSHISFNEVNQKTMYPLSDGKLLNSFQNIKKEYKQVELVSVIFDLLNIHVQEEDDHASIYNLVLEAINDFKRENILSFSFKLIKKIGYQMNLKPDGREVKGFNIKLGSLVYYGDPYTIDLNLEETTLLLKLTYLSYDKIDRLGDETFTKIKQFMYDYYEYHTDARIKRK